MTVITRENRLVDCDARELEFACWREVGFLYAGRAHEWYDEVVASVPHLQTCCLNAHGQVVATLTCATLLLGDSDPSTWAGWDWAVRSSYRRLTHKFDTVCALSASVSPAYRGQGLAKELLLNLKQLARQAGASRLIAPVRPVRKAEHPRMPMSEYLQTTVDPWVRTHVALGGTLGPVCEQSIVVTRPLSFWEPWVGRQIAEIEEDFVVPGALAPVQVTRSRWGRYVEPNVWVVHNLVAEMKL